MDILVDAFLSEEDVEAAVTPKQIISLGAGTDTRPFRIFSKANHPKLIYHEVDFGVVVNKKLRAVQGNPVLSRILTNVSTQEDSSSWTGQPSSGGEYHCHGLDLRQLAQESEESSLSGLRTDIPTLVLSECCLCYLSQEEASAVLSFFTTRIPSLATAIYEPIRPDDAFGKVMISNLAARRIHMPTLDVYRHPEHQEERLREAGFDLVRQMTIEDIWDKWVKPEEKERVDGLEGLDEVEEWKLLAAHYIVVWGSRGDGFGSWSDVAGGA